MAQSARDLTARAAIYLDVQEQDILFRWTQRASRLLADAGRPAPSLSALRAQMPDILAQLRHRLRDDAPSSESTMARTSLPQEHAVTRHQQQVPAGVVVQEYHLLRREVWEALRQWPADPPLTVADVFVLEAWINTALDALIAVTLDTFVRRAAGPALPSASADDPDR